MVWNDQMSVGHAVLDSDHQILINLVNQLHDAMDTGQSRQVVGSVINVLAEYVEHHFRREEAVMAEAGVPDTEGHLRQHRALEDRVRALRDRYRAGEHAALDDEVVALLKKWLTDHILVADKSYKAWVEAAAASAALGLAKGDGTSS